MAPVLLQIKSISGATVPAVLLTLSVSVLALTYSHVYRRENHGWLRDSGLHERTFGTSSNDSVRSGLPWASTAGSKRKKIALVNVEAEEVIEWQKLGHDVEKLEFPKVPPEVRWESLFPTTFIDEDEVVASPKCPEIPLPELKEGDDEGYKLVVAKIPCSYPSEGWTRDVIRLQLHLAAAKLASGSPEGVMMLLLSPCRPMMELFRCEDLVRREGNKWFFKPDIHKLKLKLSLPVGSCRLMVPLIKPHEHAGGTDIIDINYDFSALERFVPKAETLKLDGKHPPRLAPREAYATVIHSSDSYVCGAIALARSLLHTGTTRDLVLLIHTGNPNGEAYRRQKVALVEAGWKIHEIQRLRYPHAKKDAYNEWNYTKLRLWQLTQYDKVIYLDADMVVLKNLDGFFATPQLSAAHNGRHIFNSGFMVIEPSACMFQLFMEQIPVIKSYNNGDQGFVNEIFSWWHRLPRRVNMLKMFPEGMPSARFANNMRLMCADPPVLYVLHYLGLKPWLCYRDYDCNWNIQDQRIFANDVVHHLWWELHDRLIPASLQPFCQLSEGSKIRLKEDIENAKKAGYEDRHWMKAITDPRQY